MAKAGLDQTRMGCVTAQTFHHTIRGALTHEECQSSTALRQGFTQFLEELIIDADITQGTRCRSGSSPHSQAHKGVEKQQTNQHPPKTATGSPCGGEVDRLFQVNMAVFTMFQNTRIFKRDQVLLLNRDQLMTNLFGFLHIGKTDHKSDRS